jgi:thiamine biosynthesis lipoprotein
MESVSRRELLTFDIPASGPAADHWIRVQRHAMACRFEVLLSGEDGRHVPAARDALAEVARLEDELSVFRDTSRVSDLNRRAAREPVEVDAGLFALLELCRTLSEETAGAFDVTSGPLSSCWRTARRDGRLPAANEIERARQTAGIHRVVLDAAARSVVFTAPGVAVNFGAVGKGWALDRAAELLAARGVRHALLSSGGSSARAVGGRGRGFEIDLRARRGGADGGRLARAWLREGALGTSGSGEQYLEIDGQRYGHVIDPRSGWPASGVLSASVFAAEAAVADALSTAFLVGGVGLARDYCSVHPDVLAVITLDDGGATPVAVGAFPGAELDIP